VKPTLLRQGSSVEAMYPLSQTFRLINERLSGNEALSDKTMVLVIAMTQYERSQGHYIQGLVHFKGLQQLVKLQGGISHLLNS
jgi:hypothetical protein